jgi:hypothetical protein
MFRLTFYLQQWGNTGLENANNSRKPTGTMSVDLARLAKIAQGEKKTAFFALKLGLIEVCNQKKLYI